MNGHVKLWIRVHRWTSLICTLFLLLACVTGLPLIFEDELGQSAQPNPGAASTRAAPGLSIDAIIARVQRERARHVSFVFWEDDRADRIGLGVSAMPDADAEHVQRVLVDAHTGEAVETLEPPAWLSTLHELHSDLLLGEFGDTVLGVMALLFVMSTLSGIVIYAPFMRRLAFGEIRRTSRKRTWLDLHNLVGIATAAWALVVGATGLMNTLEARLFEAWQSERLPALLASHANDASLRASGSLDSAVIAARNALPGMQITSIGLAGTRYGTPRHHLVWLHGSSPLTQRLFATVLIAADSGRVERAEALPWYLRALEVSRPLHFGDYGGLPMKVLWACFDVSLIGVLASGIYLWFAKRPRAAVRAHANKVRAEATDTQTHTHAHARSEPEHAA